MCVGRQRSRNARNLTRTAERFKTEPVRNPMRILRATVIAAAALLVASRARAQTEASSAPACDEPARPASSGDGPTIPTPENPDAPREAGTSLASASSAAPEVRRAAPARRPEREPPRRAGDPERLNVTSMAGAYFYRPEGGARRARVIVYMHPRNGSPREGCRTFHEAVRRFGWLLCPIGAVDRGGGRREWRNDRDYANRETILALEELAARFPGRVRRHDNVIIGFSEGSYVGMNVALMNPQTFPRWFIIAADDRYIDGEEERIRRAAPSLRRVYFVTGIADGVVQNTRRAYDMLARSWGRRRIRMQILRDAGHELPPDFVRTVRNVLFWVTAD